MDYYNMEEMVTLQYGSFAALSKQAKVMLKKGSWVSSQGSAIPRKADEGTPWLEDNLVARVGSFC